MTTTIVGEIIKGIAYILLGFGISYFVWEPLGRTRGNLDTIKDMLDKLEGDSYANTK